MSLNPERELDSLIRASKDLLIKQEELGDYLENLQLKEQHVDEEREKRIDNYRKEADAAYYATKFLRERLDLESKAKSIERQEDIARIKSEEKQRKKGFVGRK